MSRVIAIANQKGGVGKTTTAINLGASLAAAEQRTLVIDLDPQANLTSGLGLSQAETPESLYLVLLEYAPIGAAVCRGVHLPQLDVVPSSQALVGAEVELMAMPDRESRLRRALFGVRNMYDYVLLDCPPAFGMLTLNALVAADSVLVPVQPEFFALEGLSQIHESIEHVRRLLNPRLALEGLLLTLYDPRLLLTRQVEREVERAFPGGRTFRTRVPRNVRLAEAPSFGRPALLYDIASLGAQRYLTLAAELIERTSGARPTATRRPAYSYA